MGDVTGVGSIAGFKDLRDAVELFIAFLIPAVAAFAAVGLLAAAFIELAKNMFYLRRHFHEKRLSKVAERRANLAKTFIERFDPTRKRYWKRLVEAGPIREGVTYDYVPAEIEFKRFKSDFTAQTSSHDLLIDNVIKLSTCGDDTALYDLKPNKLVGQIDAAYQLSLSAPSKMPAIIWFAGEGADESEIEDILLIDWMRSVLRNDDLDFHKESGSKIPPDVLEIEKAARARVSAMAQRQFDAWQITYEHQWARQMQRISVALSSVIIVIVGLVRHNLNGGDPADPIDFAFWVIVAFFGGIFAPFARDFLVNLKGIGGQIK